MPLLVNWGGKQQTLFFSVKDQSSHYKLLLKIFLSFKLVLILVTNTIKTRSFKTRKKSISIFQTLGKK